MKLHGKEIGNHKDTFITFEAGPNHNGLTSAINLVDIAVGAGADAIKFQMVDADRLMRDIDAQFAYSMLNADGTMQEKSASLYSILKTYDLERDDLQRLKLYCEAEGVGFFCTVLWEDQIDFLADLGCQTVKLCSGDINNTNLLECAAKSGMIVQFDTGNADMSEICRAFEILNMFGSTPIIHHCPTGYPAVTDKINLRFIKTLKQMFDCPVAYSDHSPDYMMDIAAISAGADLLEKTITEDKTQDGVEHHYSLEMDGAVEFVKQVKIIDDAMGSGVKTGHQINYKGRMIGRRILTASEDIEAGTCLRRSNTHYTRPAILGGITPAESVYGRMTRLPIKKGDAIFKGDL
jgi:N,N'-diacetyllegionaminate synthase